MFLTLQDLLSLLSGSLVGFVLGLVGGGGSIIADRPLSLTKYYCAFCVHPIPNLRGAPQSAIRR